MSDSPDTDLEASEVFAYELMLHKTPAEDRKKAEAMWKDESPEGFLFRRVSRAEAEAFKTTLADDGLRVAKSSTPKVSRRLREIQLIPAKSAYTLEDELRPKSDDAPQLPG